MVHDYRKNVLFGKNKRVIMTALNRTAVKLNRLFWNHAIYKETRHFFNINNFHQLNWWHFVFILFFSPGGSHWHMLISWYCVWINIANIKHNYSFDLAYDLEWPWIALELSKDALSLRTQCTSRLITIREIMIRELKGTELVVCRIVVALASARSR